MKIGVPKEIKPSENRIALLPVGAEQLIAHGHEVYVETNAGVGSGFDNDAYLAAGAKILPTPAEVFEVADMILKVKEPLPAEFPLIKEDQILFTYFHFAAGEELTLAIRDTKSIAIAYETVSACNGELPLLVPMSEVAGRMATQEGAKYLEHRMGGRGVLLGGVPGVLPGKVVVLGGGVVGTNAAKMAAGLGARVIMMDLNLERLRYLDDVMPSNVITMMSNPENIRREISDADLVVGAVLIAGAKAPHLITRDMLKLMPNRSVVVDVAVDQGGCIETCKPTTHDDPVYTVENVLHYCVANMPGAVPFTSTLALTNATLPFAIKIANLGAEKAALKHRSIYDGINMYKGKVTYDAVAEAFDLEYTPLDELLS